MLWADLVDCDGKNRPTGPEISETSHADLLIKFKPPLQPKAKRGGYLGICHERDTRRRPEEEMMKFRANKAPGPSGVSIESIKLMSDENLERLVETMNGIMTGGEQVPESWDMTLLRPLPKTEAGLY